MGSMVNRLGRRKLVADDIPFINESPDKKTVKENLLPVIIENMDIHGFMLAQLIGESFSF
jgi:hypothetical protein